MHLFETPAKSFSLFLVGSHLPSKTLFCKQKQYSGINNINIELTIFFGNEQTLLNTTFVWVHSTKIKLISITITIGKLTNCPITALYETYMRFLGHKGPF